MSYHITDIVKGELGYLSKIREELDEAFDAEQQKVGVMVLLELSDMIGAVGLYLEKHHPSVTVYDLIKMADLTKRAFESGARK